MRSVFAIAFTACAFTIVALGQTAPPQIKNDTNRRPNPPAIRDQSIKPSTDTPKVKPENIEDEVVMVVTDLVTPPVSVLDRNGRFNTGLTQRDFRLLENGIPQKIKYF